MVSLILVVEEVGLLDIERLVGHEWLLRQERKRKLYSPVGL